MPQTPRTGELLTIQTRNKMTPPRVANEAASSRDNNLANSKGTQTISPKNALLKVERTRSRIGKNRTRADSDEHRKPPNHGPGTPLSDATLIGAAQRVEHYEIAAYGTASKFAKILGESEHVTLLEETLQEEKETDERADRVGSRD